jgi:hypothetical protein
MKTNKHGYTSQQLRETAEWIRSLDPRDIVEEYLRHRHACPSGTYAAIILWPEKQDHYCINEVSRCCASEEYFGESGVMSRKTLLSGIRDHWTPGPDDGFEWIERTDGDYAYPPGDPAKWVSVSDDASPKIKPDWIRFDVSDNPVDGWLNDADYDLDQVTQKLDKIADEMEAEAGEMDKKEGNPTL